MAASPAPLIGNVLSYILILLMIYLLFYSIEIKRKGLNLDTLPPEVPPPAPRPEPPKSGPALFYIEPSPVPGQQIPYPTISQFDPDRDLSIVIPIHDFEWGIADLLNSILTYFTNQMLTFEILVVDICSLDHTRDRVLEIASQTDKLRLLTIPYLLSSSSACLIGATRTRGASVFLFNTDDQISIESFPLFHEQLLRPINPTIVIGCWLATRSQDILRSTLNVWLEVITSAVLRLAGVRYRASDHCRSFLMTREAVRSIFSQISVVTQEYDIEILVAAARSGVEMRTAVLGTANPRVDSVSSINRLDQLWVALVTLVSYTIGNRRRVILPPRTV
jgi:hypothetical protein